MASIVKRNKSYSVVYYDLKGKQVWESGYTHSEAKERKTTVEYEEYQMNAEGLTSISLQEFMTDFVEKYGAKKWGTSYYNSSLGLLKNYVYPYWGDIAIHEFNVKNIDDYYDCLIKKPVAGMGKKATPSLIYDIHKLLRCAFNQAKKWQLIPINPFLDATLPEYKMKQRPALTPSQLETVLDYTDNPEIYDLYLIHVAMNLAFAGSMRGGEIGALQWSDILDSDNRVIHISKAIDRVGKKALEKVTKTDVYFQFPNLYPGCKSAIVLKNTKEDGGSDRNAYLPEAVYEKVMTLKSLQDAMKEELGTDGYISYNLIICQANGRPIMTEHLNKRFQVILNELGIKPKGAKDGENFVFHSIRSTATTYKLRISGGDIKAVQGENGQKDPSMVTKQYSRILDEDRQRISRKLDHDFYGKKDAASPINNDNLVDILSALQSNPDILKALMERTSVG